MHDLFILVADKNMEFTVKGLLRRTQSLGIRRIDPEPTIKRRGGDGGVRTIGPEILRLETNRFSHALMILDYEGSGGEKESAIELEKSLDERLQADWGENGKTIVISPEVDIWMWGSDAILAKEVEWPHDTGIRPWLQEKGFEFDADQKPERPKEALETVCREARYPRSSALYEKVASRIGLRKCRDDAFQRLHHQLKIWFPPDAENQSF